MTPAHFQLNRKNLTPRAANESRAGTMCPCCGCPKAANLPLCLDCEEKLPDKVSRSLGVRDYGGAYADALFRALAFLGGDDPKFITPQACAAESKRLTGRPTEEKEKDWDRSLERLQDRRMLTRRHPCPT